MQCPQPERAGPAHTDDPSGLPTIAYSSPQPTVALDCPPVAQSPGISQILQKPSTWSMRYALKYCARWDSRRFHLAVAEQPGQRAIRHQTCPFARCVADHKAGVQACFVAKCECGRLYRWFLTTCTTGWKLGELDTTQRSSTQLCSCGSGADNAKHCALHCSSPWNKIMVYLEQDHCVESENYCSKQHRYPEQTGSHCHRHVVVTVYMVQQGLEHPVHSQPDGLWVADTPQNNITSRQKSHWCQRSLTGVHLLMQ